MNMVITVVSHHSKMTCRSRMMEGRGGEGTRRDGMRGEGGKMVDE